MMRVEGFGRPATSRDLSDGELAHLRLNLAGIDHQFLIMRINDRDYSHDLVLAQASGPPIAGGPLGIRETTPDGDYVTLPGEVVVRPTDAGRPVAGYLADGSLVVTSDSRAYVYLNQTRQFVDLQTGEQFSRRKDFAVYANWEIVQIVGDRENVLASYSAVPT